MTDIDTSREAVERLAEKCMEQGNIAHERPGCVHMMRALWSAEDMLRALLARAEAAEEERDAAKAEAERLREALEKIANAPSEMTWGEDSEVLHTMNTMEAIADAVLQENSNDLQE